MTLLAAPIGQPLEAADGLACGTINQWQVDKEGGGTQTWHANEQFPSGAEETISIPDRDRLHIERIDGTVDSHRYFGLWQYHPEGCD